MKNTIRKACWLPLVALCVLAAISCEKKDPKVPLEASLAQTAWQGTYEYDIISDGKVKKRVERLKLAFYMRVQELSCGAKILKETTSQRLITNRLVSTSKYGAKTALLIWMETGLLKKEVVKNSYW